MMLFKKNKKRANRFWKKLCSKKRFFVARDFLGFKGVPADRQVYDFRFLSGEGAQREVNKNKIIFENLKQHYYADTDKSKLYREGF